MSRISNAIEVTVTAMFGLLFTWAARGQFIDPGSLWLDNRGAPIQAHGGGVVKSGDTWYWFGEDYTPTNDPDRRYIACYSSTNLIDWTFRNQVVQLANPDTNNLDADWVLQRPKVFYNTNTEQYVMYMHLDNSEYTYAHVAVATCDTVDGNYTYQRDFQPLGYQSRDIGQFIDDDGTAYLIFEDRPNGFHIAKLSEDYLDVASDVCLITNHLEGGALVHCDSRYYVIGSHLTGWDPNPDVYATATNLAGPWSEFKDFAPTNLNTYGSQSTELIKVVGSNTTTVLYLGDMWRPSALWDSRYLWLPLQIGGGDLSLPQPYSWTINVGSGVATDALSTVEGTFEKLDGTIIGTPGSWQDIGNTISNVFDGNLMTFFDGPDSSGGSNCWAGLDLGAGNARSIAEIKYCPRTEYADLMVGGKFQGANTADFSDAEDLFTINFQPPTNVMTSQVVVNPTPFRYVRYLSPVDGWGNVSEVEFDMFRPQLYCDLQENQLQLNWTTSFGVWRLQMQTNFAGTNWWAVAGAGATNPISLSPTGGQYFFRLIYP